MSKIGKGYERKAGTLPPSRLRRLLSLPSLVDEVS